MKVGERPGTGWGEAGERQGRGRGEARGWLGRGREGAEDILPGPFEADETGFAGRFWGPGGGR